MIALAKIGLLGYDIIKLDKNYSLESQVQKI